MDSYDLAIIGAGPGGYVAAIRAAQLGLKVALVEKDPALGGTCLNVGCVPSKALLESSELYLAASEHAAEHGVLIDKLGFDVAQMLARKQRIVDELTTGIATLMKKNRVKVLPGRGVLTASGRITVHSQGEETEIAAAKILLAMGSVPVELPFLRFDGTHVVSSTEVLAFTEVPKHLLVVGAGAIGLELGSVWRRLGAEVTVVELLPTIAPFADKQIAKTLERALSAQGMRFLLSSKVTGAEISNDMMAVSVENKKGETEQFSCDKVLVAVGRKACTQGSGLTSAGIEFDKMGRVEVDEKFQTSIDGVYAIGDLIRGPMLAHKAEDEGMAVAELIAGQQGHINYDTIPGVVYTAPELAQVGRTEAELKQQGIRFATGRFLFRANARAKSLGEEDGMVKIFADRESNRILGVHIVGPRASELIAEAVLAMQLGATARDLAATVHAHPTLSEVVREAALAVDKRAIHA